MKAAALTLALVVLCAVPARAALAPGDHRIALEHGGRQRSYIVHAPPAAREGRPLPVILNSPHSLGSTAEAEDHDSGEGFGKPAFSATGPKKEAGPQLEELRAGSWAPQPGGAGAADGDRPRLLVCLAHE